MNKGRYVFSQLCDLLIEQKEEESTEEKNSSSASILTGNYQFVTF